MVAELQGADVSGRACARPEAGNGRRSVTRRGYVVVYCLLIADRVSVSALILDQMLLPRCLLGWMPGARRAGAGAGAGS